MNDDMNPSENERLRRLLDDVAALPREVKPPADAWSAISRRIEAQRVVAIAPGPRRRAARAARGWAIGAAATVLLMVGAFLAMRGRGKAAATNFAGAAAGGDSARVVAQAPDSTHGPVRAVTSIPVAGVAADAAMAAAIEQYQQAARELEASVAARAASLPPETREVVRHSLATIDGAIADLRAALGHDPANAGIGQYLTAMYEQKLDFLKRVRALPGAGM